MAASQAGSRQGTERTGERKAGSDRESRREAVLLGRGSLTGGDVLLKSSEAAELECEGVRGVMLSGNW